jgi:hypothetical protein
MVSDKKKYIDQLFKLIRIFVLASSEIEPPSKPGEAADQVKKPAEGKSQNEENKYIISADGNDRTYTQWKETSHKEDAYTTPKKQIKKAAEKTAVSAFDVGQITQETLFGDSDPAPEQEDVGQESGAAKPKEEEKEKDSLDHLRTALKESGLAQHIIRRADIPSL